MQACSPHWYLKQVDDLAILALKNKSDWHTRPPHPGNDNSPPLQKFTSCQSKNTNIYIYIIYIYVSILDRHDIDTDVYNRQIQKNKLLKLIILLNSTYRLNQFNSIKNIKYLKKEPLSLNKAVKVLKELNFYVLILNN